MNQIGQIIKKERKKQGYKQFAFAKLCGLSQTSLSQIENGITYPSKTSLSKILSALNVTDIKVRINELTVNDLKPMYRSPYFEIRLEDMIKELNELLL